MIKTQGAIRHPLPQLWACLARWAVALGPASAGEMRGQVTEDGAHSLAQEVVGELAFVIRDGHKGRVLLFETKATGEQQHAAPSQWRSFPRTNSYGSWP